MNCDVFDTYVTKTDGQLMHFDIIVPSGTDTLTVLGFGQQYLAQVGAQSSQVTTDQCRFCHVEQATPEMASAIDQQGYYILPMEGCP